MFKRAKNTLIMILLLSAAISSRAQNSIFSSGEWAKIAVEKTSIIKLTYDELASSGFPVSSINPDQLQIFGSEGGMLPQANDSSVFNDPQEIAIEVITQQNGLFQNGDYILFYAEGPDYIDYDRSTDNFIYQHHLFTDRNFFYLTANQSDGKRIQTSAPLGGGDLLSTGIAYEVYEKDLFNILHSGREWYGEKFDLNTSQEFETQLDNLAAGAEIKITSSVMSASKEPASFQVYINEILAGEQSINANPNSTYGRKGTSSTDQFVLNESEINGTDLSIRYNFDKSSGIGYLNYYLLQTEVNLSFATVPKVVFTGNFMSSGNRTVQITEAPSDIKVWDVSNPYEVYELPTSFTDEKATVNLGIATEVIAVFTANNAANVVEIQELQNQNIKAVSNSDLLIVTNEEFEDIAEQIAALREEEGITANVVTDTEIYNEFSSGKQDITAIRNYAKFLFENAGLKYLLIFGKGTYDPKDITETALSKLPIYQSRNSLFPLATYSSDDYLGFMEDHEGEWEENNANDHTMDIGVGRIPITNETEAELFLVKLKKYKGKSALGDWRQKVVFVAENGDANIHQRDAERLTTLIDTTYEAFTTKKIYVDAYPIEVNPGSNRAPEVNKEIFNAINSGALIVNYTGHGNEVQWANTKIFDTRVIDSLTNERYLPLFVTATCEFGRHDDTGAKSGGEELIILKETGAIATITTARPVFASSNYQLNQAFYNTVFERVDGQYQRLGDIFKKTKNNSLNGVLNRNFSLLGDPSMKLSYGEQLIILDSLNGELINQNDTLKSLELLQFSGSMRDATQMVDQSFNGVADIKIFDRQQSKETLGNLGASPFTYKVRDNILFSGSAKVTNGQFDFSTVLPKDISYNPSSARLVIYGYKSDSLKDASGANIDLLIGSSSSQPIIDNVPPEVAIFIGDTLFRNGGTVNENSLLVVKLFDLNGINTSSSQVGHSITYQLDGNDPVELNEFYQSEIDDFTKGWIYYNLSTLTPGNHSLRVTAWDTSNNSTTEEVEFTVLGKNQIVISELLNYPNPMLDQTTFTFNHNLGGEDLEVRLEIISTSGQKMYSETRTYESAPSRIQDWQWDGRTLSGGKLISGIYIYGVFVRSTSSGNVQNQFSRLFISN